MLHQIVDTQSAVSSRTCVCVVGLGYVGLPLAVALSRTYDVVGLDIDQRRIEELKNGYDRTGEIDPDRLREARLAFEHAPEACAPSDAYIITIPTPVDRDNRPDLTLLTRASETVARMLDARRKPVVIYESTVYPGVTEEICGPILEAHSGLIRGEDFFLAYSPERINPGDREHTVDRITKVVAGENPEVTRRVAALYQQVTTGGTFSATSIKVAEAAKVIENAQRDINIAFMNEIAQIFGRMDISVWDVLEAARTKWNFLPFQPGLVGGHCIGVDPYYLSHRAEELGHDPAVILAGRATNDGMGAWVADQLGATLAGPSDVLVLGLTFKENVPDLRNSKVADVVQRLTDLGHRVTVHDPHADAEEAWHEYRIRLTPEPAAASQDVVLLAVPHQNFHDRGSAGWIKLLRPGGTLADLKGVLKQADLPESFRYWSL